MISSWRPLSVFLFFSFLTYHELMKCSSCILYFSSALSACLIRRTRSCYSSTNRRVMCVNVCSVSKRSVSMAYWLTLSTCANAMFSMTGFNYKISFSVLSNSTSRRNWRARIVCSSETGKFSRNFSFHSFLDITCSRRVGSAFYVSACASISCWISSDLWISSSSCKYSSMKVRMLYFSWKTHNPSIS